MKKRLIPSQKIYLEKSTIQGAGLGVFAATTVKKGEIIEACPVLVVPRKEYPVLKKTTLRNYYFMWGSVTVGICFGFGSYYNHSYSPNATYSKNIKERTIQFIALRNIKKDEEITVNYNYGDPDDKKQIWIDTVESVE